LSLSVSLIRKYAISSNNNVKKKKQILPELLSFDDTPLGDIGESNGVVLVGVFLKTIYKSFEISIIDNSEMKAVLVLECTRNAVTSYKPMEKKPAGCCYRSYS